MFSTLAGNREFTVQYRQIDARHFSVLPGVQTGGDADAALPLSMHPRLSNHLPSFVFEVKGEWS
jgi:hypothetical protein